MYVLAPWKKADPVIRWNLPDRIFFGHGACHILAGVFINVQIAPQFRPFWFRPENHSGSHVFVSDGELAFDYHGYSNLERLKAHHFRVWERQYPGWNALIEPAGFDLLNTEELNRRNMRGPDQYLGDPVQRAADFLHRIDHSAAAEKARWRVIPYE